jgi:hypothetical protein
MRTKIYMQPSIPDQDKDYIHLIQRYTNLLRDLHFIYENLKRSSSYNETSKNEKKNNIKNLTGEIEKGVMHLNSKDGLSKIVRANLEILNVYFSKNKSLTL